MYFTAILAVLVGASSAQYLVSPYSTFGSIHPYSAYSPYFNPYLGYSAVTPEVVQRVAAPLALPISTQYHAQDELGQFTFGHSSPLQAREESKTFDGTVRGSYSYVDPNGKLNQVIYKAGHEGFQILGANNLPVAPEAPLAPVVALPKPVEDTPEVVAARAEFSRKFEETKARAVILPVPVKDTPEVVAARADFEKKFEEAKIAAEKAPEEIKSRRRRSVVLPITPISYDFPYIRSLPAIAPITPVIGKTIVKTAELKTLEDAKVPASTKLAEVKETEKEILTPLTYSALPYSTYPYSTYPYTAYPYSALPYSTVFDSRYPYVSGVYPLRR